MMLPSQFKEENSRNIRIYHYVEELVGSYKEFMNRNNSEDEIPLSYLPFLLRIRFSNNTTQKDLTKLFNVSKGYTARLLKSFEDLGWITREENPDNHREKIVKLTDEGMKKTDEIIKKVDQWEDMVTSSLSDTEVMILKKLLFDVVVEADKI
ncbi:MarR family winged helix-turn-helix transcriptional regulator [Methanobrevibacter boviskoreani]|uniref:MarR family winged helix-turn-helix transcriptional regulator n=1 Tax=Methanobrevibacter boviskoreani TaxID=1348249 RepID=UPI0023A798EA|nr:MarR family transcriptional regulator [Methanobrevibacter boviskoreani]MCI6774388.1 MarR family transcriptional regulator [Methanobrevibacter boviskoreani]MDY5613886.1 MarR family transcriptional regulator [Methanobrevibacter boviskoreani]